MSRYTDPDYLKQQYGDAANLSARIRLHQLFNTNPQELQHWAFDRMLKDAPPRCRILELGCGNGEFWRKNAGRIPTGWQITVSDFSAGMLADAQKSLAGLATKFDFRGIDAQNIPCDDQSFDLVMAHFMLYHVPNRAQAIAEIRRILKPDGCLHAMTLGANHLRELHELAHQIAPEVFPTRDAVSRTFGLENGVDQLLTSFGEVTLIRYDCDLEITELAPLVDYVLSMARIDPDDERLLSFRTTAQARLDQDGRIHIAKDTGLLVARGYAGVRP